MAIRANAVCTAMIHREESMSHRRAQPICCSVARRTGSGRGEDSNGGGVSGGTTEQKAPIPGQGWFAACTDPDGNSFSLFQSDPSITVEQMTEYQTARA